MNFNKKLATAVSGVVLLMAGQIALADSTTDIVDALVTKGVLTEEEGKLITKGHTTKAKAEEKANKSRISVGSFIDNATMYGDIRARYERRDGDHASDGVNIDSNRARYKITLGVETKAGDWYSDLAFAMSDNGRSDNISFGDNVGSTLSTKGPYAKSASGLFVKRAMLGWNATDWLAIEVGKMKNPLYMVNAMVFDHDIVFEGAQEKLKYKLGDTNLFANLGQWIYTGPEVASTNGGTTTTGRQNMVLAFQAGAEQAFIADKLSAKGAVGYYNYTADNSPTYNKFVPVTGTTGWTPAAVGVNDLAILDIPMEVDYMVSQNIGIRPYAEYAYNTNGSDRQKASGVTGPNDDTAWLVGISVGSAKDLKSFAGKKMAKGDWNANLWYQSVGVYALDPNSVDTDIFDGRVNMEGTSLKAQYNIEDNIALNFTGAWGDRKNDYYGAMSGNKVDVKYSSGDAGITKYNLYQFDVTYKF